uniref:Uncharacterized protein n=1 Tax=Rhizophora mucronata TaxID=61149 RepID=A0A2P2JGS0_RHIMU
MYSVARTNASVLYFYMLLITPLQPTSTKRLS